MIELLLNVNHEMRECKTRFWQALELNPICDPEHITLAAAQTLTKSKKLEAWWKKSGFAEWFSAGDEYEVKLAAAKFSAIDTLIDIMQNPDSPASARVAAAKQVMDHAKNAEKEDSSVEKLLDKIAGVNNIEELNKFIK